MLRPPHGIHDEWFHYKQFKTEINRYFDTVFAKFPRLDKNEKIRDVVKKIFWDIVDRGDYPVDNIYYRFVCVFTNSIHYLLLFDMGEISIDLKNCWFAWNAYLNKKIIISGYFLNPDDTIINDIATNFPHQEEITSLYEHITLKDIEPDHERVKKNIVEFWDDFGSRFTLGYELFVKNSLYVGKEINQKRNKKYKNIIDLYQIKSSSNDLNENSPQEPLFDLNSLIFELAHIRNSISHRLYKFNLDSQTIELWDKNPDLKETFRKIYSKEELIKMEKFLWILRRGLRNQAMFHSIERRLGEYMANKEGKDI
jgi:hypothetical protein